eukprot:COSAG02_NODE_6861_length_3321_cov_2.928305_2_plen_68_part_00
MSRTSARQKLQCTGRIALRLLKWIIFEYNGCATHFYIIVCNAPLDKANPCSFTCTQWPVPSMFLVVI